MKWLTRERPKIDRLACPWLIRKFVDQHAEFIYVPFADVPGKAAELDVMPFVIPGVEFTHYGDQSTFDYIKKIYNIADPAINIMEDMVRGADTDRHELARETAGLWAISSGLSYNIINDDELLSFGLVIYDALYSWATQLRGQSHLNHSPFENLLHEVYKKFLSAKEASWIFQQLLSRSQRSCAYFTLII